jgi:hypothetical protein
MLDGHAGSGDYGVCRSRAGSNQVPGSGGGDLVVWGWCQQHKGGIPILCVFVTTRPQSTHVAVRLKASSSAAVLVYALKHTLLQHPHHAMW